MPNRYWKIANRIILTVLFIITIWTFFSKDNYRSVDKIHSAVTKEPIQTEVSASEPIIFNNNDYEYNLTPLFRYEINAMIVHMMDYRWFSLKKMDSVFPVDLCLIWGENVSSKVYQSKKLKFSQDARFAYWSWSGDLKFNGNEVANTHLLIEDKHLEKELEQLNRGDQIKIKGHLVNVEAKNIGKPGKYDPAQFSLNTSVVRSDTGAGACEIVYIENMEILEKGNPTANSIFKISWSLFLIYIGANILWFLKSIFLV